MVRFTINKSFVLTAASAMLAPAALPAHADVDTVTLRLGLIQVNGDAQLRGAANEDADLHYLSKRFDFGHKTVPRIEGVYHFSKRNRVLFNYLRFAKRSQFTLDRDIGVNGINIFAGDQASAKAELNLGSLVYDYALAESQSTSFALQIGAAWADINGRVSADDGPVIVGEHKREAGVAPVLGARFSSHTTDQRWGFNVQGQYVNTKWGNFDTYSGSITRLNGVIEYRFTQHFGIYGGYDWFRLDVSHNFGELSGGVDLRFKGPTLGLTLAF